MIYQVIGDVDIFTIAQWFYGDAGAWDVVYYANRELIGDDPEAISAGMELEIPEIESSEETYQIQAPEAI